MVRLPCQPRIRPCSDVLTLCNAAFFLCCLSSSLSLHSLAVRASIIHWHWYPCSMYDLHTKASHGRCIPLLLLPSFAWHGARGNAGQLGINVVFVIAVFVRARARYLFCARFCVSCLLDLYLYDEEVASCLPSSLYSITAQHSCTRECKYLDYFLDKGRAGFKLPPGVARAHPPRREKKAGQRRSWQVCPRRRARRAGRRTGQVMPHQRTPPAPTRRHGHVFSRARTNDIPWGDRGGGPRL